MKTKFLINSFIAAVAILYLSGCAAVIVGGAAGAGTYAYLRGEMKGTESAALDRAWSATQTAMKDLEFSVTTRQKDALQARLIARTARDQRIEIKLSKLSDKATEIRVRVGTFGDQALSHTIVQQIEKRL